MVGLLNEPLIIAVSFGYIKCDDTSLHNLFSLLKNLPILIFTYFTIDTVLRTYVRVLIRYKQISKMKKKQGNFNYEFKIQ